VHLGDSRATMALLRETGRNLRVRARDAALRIALMRLRRQRLQPLAARAPRAGKNPETNRSVSAPITRGDRRASPDMPRSRSRRRTAPQFKTGSLIAACGSSQRHERLPQAIDVRRRGVSCICSDSLGVECEASTHAVCRCLRRDERAVDSKHAPEDSSRPDCDASRRRRADCRPFSL